MLNVRQVVRKVDELQLPRIAEALRKRKREHYFTEDTQALVDTSMFVKVIGKGLVDCTEPIEDPVPETLPAPQISCTCGDVHWPNCPLNPVRGDPTDFLRARREAKLTWAVVKVQARWRGFSSRRRVHATVRMPVLQRGQPIIRDSSAEDATQRSRPHENAMQNQGADAVAELQVCGHMWQPFSYSRAVAPPGG